MTSDDVEALIDKGARRAREQLAALGPGVEIHVQKWLREQIVPELLEGVDVVTLLAALREHKRFWLAAEEAVAEVSVTPQEAVLRAMTSAVFRRLT